MIQPAAIASKPGRRAVVIDLIGDLDSMLGDIFAETLGRLANAGEANVVVTFKHIAAVHDDGFTRVARAIAESRLGGCAVAVLAQNRRIRSLLSGAKIPCEAGGSTFGRGRHVMIARHSPA